MKKRIATLLLLLLGLVLLVAVLTNRFEIDHGPSPAAALGLSEMPTPDLLADDRPLATLVRMERSVKAKRADELAWMRAQEEMSLYGNDSVRTFDRSSANILFGQRDIIEIDENSLIIITNRRSRNENEISMALLSPALLEKINAQPVEEQERLLQKAMASREVQVMKISGGGTDGEGVRVGVKSLPGGSNALVSRSGRVRVI